MFRPLYWTFSTAGGPNVLVGFVETCMDVSLTLEVSLVTAWPGSLFSWELALLLTLEMLSFLVGESMLAVLKSVLSNFRFGTFSIGELLCS